MTAPPASLPQAIVLSRMSWHLDSLAEEVHGIEHAIGDELDGSNTQSIDTITRLQRLDFVRQSLEDMAQLTLFLADHETHLPVDAALAKLRLTASKLLLRCIAEQEQQVELDAASGDVDLF